MESVLRSHSIQRTSSGRRLTVLASAALGLYCSRVIAELLCNLYPKWVLLFVVSASLVASLRLVTLLHRHHFDVSALYLLFLYVIWPWPWPRWMWAVGLLASLVLILQNESATRGLRLKLAGSSELHDALLFGASLLLYVQTLSPTVLPADSGEFQLVGYVLGIAHPPGYPLYTILAKLFTLLPVGDVAFRVNLMSAVTSALTLVVLSRSVRRMTGCSAAGWSAALGLGLAPTFWAQSTVAGIRSLTALFVAIQVGALLLYDQTREGKHLTDFALAFGLGIGHHASLAPLVAVYLPFLVISNPTLLRQPRAWCKPLVALLLSLTVLLYLPVRSWMGAPFDPQPIRNLSGFLEHVLALGFRGDMLHYTNPSVLLPRIKVLWNILNLEFYLPLLLLAVWGCFELLRQHPRWLLLLGGVWLGNSLLAVTYRAPQTVEYLMPSYVSVACAIAYGAWSLYRAIGTWSTPVRRWAVLPLALAMLFPMLTAHGDYPSFASLSEDRSAQIDASTMLSLAPRGARILASWHHATPLWYLQLVEGQRPDVEVIYVYPEGAEPIAQTWVRRILDSSVSRPTIVTNRYPEFSTLPLGFHPLAEGWLAQTDAAPIASSRGSTPGIVFDGRIELVNGESGSTKISPAEHLLVRVSWRPVVQLERDYSLFVHLIDEQGVPIGQGDVTHAAGRYQVGQLVEDEFRIPILPSARPGQYRLIAGIYITLDNGGWQRLLTPIGQDSTQLGEIQVLPLTMPPVTRNSLWYPFSNGCVLVGVDYDRSIADQLRLYLHWFADEEVGQLTCILVFSGQTLLNSAEMVSGPQGTYHTTVHDLPPAASGLALELQDVTTGLSSRVSGPWKLPGADRLCLPNPVVDARYVPLGGEMVLLQVLHSVSVIAGTSVPVELALVGARPLTNDYTVSVSLEAESGGWRAQHDGTPALGAIPTLKWIRGTVVEDVHYLELPAEATGRAVLRVTVYDAFTTESLPVLDDRLARLGQGMRFTIGTVDVR